MIEIIPVNTAIEIKQIEHLADVIWRQHYIPIIGLEQVDYMLSTFQSETAIVQQLEENYEYYLILEEENNIGYVSIQRRAEYLFLSKIYLLAAQRGKGIGRTVMKMVFDRAIAMGCSAIQLTVNKYNSNAMRAYEKIGFIKKEAIVQDIGNGFVMDDFVYEYRLEGGR